MLKQSLNSGGFFAANLLFRLLLALALGKAFTPEEYGIYVLITTVVAMTTLLLPLDASQYYMREVPGRPAGDGAAIFKSVVGSQTMILTLLAMGAALIPGIQQLAVEKMGVSRESWIFGLIVCVILAESLANDLVRYLYARREIERGNEVTFLQGSLWGLLVFATYLISPQRITLSFVVALWLASLCLAIGYGLWRSKPRELWRATFKPALYGAALRFGAPLLTARLGLAMDWVARFYLVWLYSEAAVGAYTYTYGLIVMIASVTAPIHGAVEPHAVALFNQGEQSRSGELLSASLRYRMLMVMPLLLVAVTASHELISLLARPEYAVADALMALLAPVPVLVMLSTTLERVLNLERRVTAIARGYVLSAVIQLLLYALLVPLHPYYGTALARTIGAAALVAIFLYDTRLAPLRIQIPYGRLILAALPSLFVAGVISTADFLPTLWRLALATIACCSALVITARMCGLVSDAEAQTLRDAVRQAAGRIFTMLPAARSSKATHP